MESTRYAAVAGLVVMASLLAGCHTAPSPETGVATIHPGMVTQPPRMHETPVLLGAGDAFGGASYAAYLAYLEGTTGAEAVAGASSPRPE